jgi:hypothetical protein
MPEWLIVTFAVVGAFAIGRYVGRIIQGKKRGEDGK